MVQYSIGASYLDEYIHQRLHGVVGLARRESGSMMVQLEEILHLR